MPTNPITLDIQFDRYGDLRFNYGDIVTLQDQGDIYYQNIVNRIITGFGDYKRSQSIGPNIKGWIGKPVTEKMEIDIKNAIIFSLTVDGFLDTSDIKILTLSQKSKLFVRLSVVIGNGRSFAYEKVIINSVFNAVSGQYYASV